MEKETNEQLLEAILVNDVEKARNILPEIKNINLKDKYGLTYLHRAVEDNKIEIVKFILSRPDIDLNAKGIDNYTPVLYAASNNLPEILQLLIQRGADIHITDNN